VYVCVCHAVTEDDVRCRIAEGACTAKEIRTACGMRRGCGSCVRRICTLLQERDATPAPAPAPAPAPVPVPVGAELPGLSEGLELPLLTRRTPDNR
jgi:bacterioferritin-associated ferredoxin